MDELTPGQIEILKHTVINCSNGLYCGDSPDMQKLIELGLMEFAGRKSFVPDPYFRITDAGFDRALEELENDG